MLDQAYTWSQVAWKWIVVDGDGLVFSLGHLTEVDVVEGVQNGCHSVVCLQVAKHTLQ